MSKPTTVSVSRMLAVVGAALICVPLASCQTPSPADKQSMSTMKAMDTDKNGLVTKDEYMKYQEQQFDKIDKDKSKTLNESEWFQHQLEIEAGSQ